MKKSLEFARIACPSNDGQKKGDPTQTLSEKRFFINQALGLSPRLVIKTIS